MGDVRDQRALRDALGTFATGVTVITTRDAKGEPWGFTANSFTSVSLDPPLVLFCLAKNAGCMATFEAAKHFAVNILADQQRDLSMLFASGRRDKFEQVAHRDANSGCPLLDDTAAWLDCVVHDRIDGGDHVIFMGRITDFAARAIAPLGYCRGAYVPLALDHRMFQATAAATTVSVGVIVEHDWSVLLKTDPATGSLSLPTAPNLGDADTQGSLLETLAARGLGQPALFVFAIFDQGDEHHVIYRTRIETLETFTPGDDLAFHRLNKLDWDALSDEPTRRTLERYLRERSDDSFGVYVGDGPDSIRQALRPIE